MKTKPTLPAAGIFLVALVNGFGQPANKAPIPGDNLWQAVEPMPAEELRQQRSLNGGPAPLGGLIEYVDTNSLVGTAFYRTSSP